MKVDTVVQDHTVSESNILLLSESEILVGTLLIWPVQHMQLVWLLVCGRVKSLPQSWVDINSGLHWSCFLDRGYTGWSETGKYLMHWSAQFSLDDFSASCSLFTLTPGTKAQSPTSLFYPRPRLALPPQAWALLTRHHPRWLTLPLPVLEVRMDGPKWRVNWTCRHPLNWQPCWLIGERPPTLKYTTVSLLEL